jgi:hypothetical protein
MSQQTLSSLQTETARWLATAQLWPSAAPDLTAVRQTRRAFEARRESAHPFGEYEFALRSAPPRPLRLSATEWENALTAPAQLFLSAVLGVQPQEFEEETPWALAQGVWVHRWLSVFTGSIEQGQLAPLPTPEDWQTRVRDAARKFRDRATAALLAQSRPMPDWWQSAWQQAESAAAQLTAIASSVQGRTHAATEWKLDNIPLPVDGGSLFVRGRIDLLLSKENSLTDVWLVDYKTGNRKALKLAELAKGKGLQLALYALALRASGARQVGLSLLAAGTTLDAPQVEIEELDTLSDLWRGLLRMQETAVFGMTGTLRDEFGFGCDYPLATLPIDEEILAQKWALTHPDFAPLEEES